MNHGNRSIAESFGIESVSRQTPWFKPERRGCEPYRVFEVPALQLKMVWAKVHSLRPHNPRQKSHLSLQWTSRSHRDAATRLNLTQSEQHSDPSYGLNVRECTGPVP